VRVKRGTETRYSLFVGPLLGFALIALAVWGNGGPGGALLCIAMGLALIAFAPIIQVVLLNTARYRGRYARACATALGMVIGALVLIALGGAFNFW
jgi:hypothetical protein